MSFEEYKNKNEGKVKEKKFRKTIKSVLLYPVKFVGAIFGVTEESLLSASSHGHGSTTPHHEPNNFKQTYRVEPPPRRTHEDMVIEHMAHDAYMDLVDGKGDNDCGHEH